MPSTGGRETKSNQATNKCNKYDNKAKRETEKRGKKIDMCERRSSKDIRQANESATKGDLKTAA